MSKSTSTFSGASGLGCPGDCRCGQSTHTSGLGETPLEDEKNKEAKSTRQDLVKTAAGYINDEIPFKYKAYAVGAGAVYLWWRTRR